MRNEIKCANVMMITTGQLKTLISRFPDDIYIEVWTEPADFWEKKAFDFKDIKIDIRNQRR